jgi:hypothetical protein
MVKHGIKEECERWNNESRKIFIVAKSTPTYYSIQGLINQTICSSELFLSPAVGVGNITEKAGRERRKATQQYNIFFFSGIELKQTLILPVFHWQDEICTFDITFIKPFGSSLGKRAREFSGYRNGILRRKLPLVSIYPAGINVHLIMVKKEFQSMLSKSTSAYISLTDKYYPIKLLVQQW